MTYDLRLVSSIIQLINFLVKLVLLAPWVVFAARYQRKIAKRRALKSSLSFPHVQFYPVKGNQRDDSALKTAS